ncbi:hypothetical protein HDV04_005504 [Boothiomyces sp. JEL0838]|nr:hypothetical protein HDV04_005504 [Boothiomyces sp. JEL0838]
MSDINQVEVIRVDSTSTHAIAEDTIALNAKDQQDQVEIEDTTDEKKDKSGPQIEENSTVIALEGEKPVQEEKRKPEKDSENFLSFENENPRPLVLTSLITPTLAIVMIILVAFITALYALFYLGCLWDPISRLPNVPVAVVIADNGFHFDQHPEAQTRVMRLTHNKTMGEVVDYFLFNPNSSASGVLKWTKLDSSTRLDDLRTMIDNGDYWGYLYVPSNFSDSVLSNLQNATTHTGYKDAFNSTIEFGYDQARQMTVTGLVYKYALGVVNGLSSAIAQTIVGEAEKYPNGYESLLTTPRYLVSPIQLEVNNMHPIPFYGYNFATYIASIVLWVCGILGAVVLFKIYQMRFQTASHLFEQKNFISRYLLSGTLVSLFITLVSASIYLILLVILARGTDFIQTDYSPLTVWVFLWLTAFCYLQFSNILAALLGPDNFSLIVSLLLILQLGSSSAILDPIVMNPVTKLSYGLPLQYSVKGLRCLMLGSQCNSMPLNYGVLFAWTGGLGLLNLAVLYSQVSKRIAKLKLEKDF